MADLTALDAVRMGMGHSRGVSSTRTEGRSEAAAEPESPAPEAAAAGAPTVAGRLLALQRTAGNQAVAALVQSRRLQREPTATPDGLTKLQSLLDDDKEEQAIAQMRALSVDDAKKLLDQPHLRKLAVKSFNDEEMARGIASLKGGTLLQKLRWMAAEDVTSFGLVWSMLVDKSVTAKEKTDLYSQNDIRAYFISLCNNDQMAAVVDVLGGDLVQKLHWMLLEGTSWNAVVEKLNAQPQLEQRQGVYKFAPMKGLFVDLLGNDEMAQLMRALGAPLDTALDWMAEEGTSGAQVFEKVRRAPDDELAKVTKETRKAIREEISGADFVRFVQMLDDRLLTWDERNFKTTEQHYELADENDASKGWELKKDFEWRTKYEILYRRSELRIRVRIKFSVRPRPRRTRRSGETASQTAGTASSTSRTTTGSRSCSSRCSPRSWRITPSSCTSRRSCARTRATGTSGRPRTPMPPSRRTPRPATPPRTSSGTSSGSRTSTA